MPHPSDCKGFIAVKKMCGSESHKLSHKLMQLWYVHT